MIVSGFVEPITKELLRVRGRMNRLISPDRWLRRVIDDVASTS
jgi:Fe-S cluster assembly scaffold protein SufB